MKSKISQNLDNLKYTDIYSLLLFALFKIKEIPEYSTLSELIYTVNKDNFLRLCEYFGGMTIRIPTIDEIEILVYSLMLYQMIDIENNNYEDALEKLNCPWKYRKDIKGMYIKLKEILNKYSFQGNKDGI